MQTLYGHFTDKKIEPLHWNSSLISHYKYIRLISLLKFTAHNVHITKYNVGITICNKNRLLKFELS